LCTKREFDDKKKSGFETFTLAYIQDVPTSYFNFEFFFSKISSNGKETWIALPESKQTFTSFSPFASLLNSYPKVVGTPCKSQNGALKTNSKHFFK